MGSMANMAAMFILDHKMKRLKQKQIDMKKTLHNSTTSGAKDNVKDIQFWGNGDTFKLISKASSKAEGWMKSTKAMQIEGVGCIVQVTTQQGDNVAEALVLVPFVHIVEQENEAGEVIGRTIEAVPHMGMPQM